MNSFTRYIAPSPEVRHSLRTARMAAMAREVGAADKPSISMGGGTTAPAPKPEVLESVAYERAAKALGYCMRCGCQVEPLKGLLDFCHADQRKGQGTKTDVRRGWPGCRNCHEEVGRRMLKPVRRAIEYLLGVMTRAAVEAAGTWPKKLPKLEPQ